MKYLLPCLLLVSTLGTSIGQEEYGEIFYTYSVPEGWSVIGMGCSGLVASDLANPARGVIALSQIHTGFGILPAYTTPESYLESYMAQDFSGENRVTNMKLFFYEDDQSLADALASGPLSSGKSMRCSFEVNGIPAEGSFTVVTRELMGYGTTVDYLAGGYAPADQFEMDAPMLLDIWNSIQFNLSYKHVCLPIVDSWNYVCDDTYCNWPCNEEGRCY